MSLGSQQPYPSSCFHPASKDNSLPFGQAGKQCRGQPWICSACYLMSVGMSVWACLPVPASQASIHVESAQSIKQLAHSSTLHFTLSPSHPSRFLSLHLCFYRMCLSPSVSDALVCFCRCSSARLPLTQHHRLNTDIPNEGWRRATINKTLPSPPG